MEDVMAAEAGERARAETEARLRAEVDRLAHLAGEQAKDFALEGARKHGDMMAQKARLEAERAGVHSATALTCCSLALTGCSLAHTCCSPLLLSLWVGLALSSASTVSLNHSLLPSCLLSASLLFSNRLTAPSPVL